MGGIPWLFALPNHSGVRGEDVIKGFMSDFVVRDDGWVLRIVGKGRKEFFKRSTICDLRSWLEIPQGEQPACVVATFV
jgi:hypothetical protein